MDESINNPHDKFVKEMLADREMAIAFLDEYLPENLRIVLKLEDLTYANTHYITPELSESFSDIVFRIPMKETNQKDVYVSLLLENKSTPEKYAAFQLLGYIANGYLTQFKNKEVIHPIIPVIYYQGKAKWKLKRIKDFFTAFPEDIQNYIPTFESIFISLMGMSDESLLALRNGMLYSAITLQKHRFNPELLEAHIERILTSINPYLSRNFIRTMIVYTLQVTEMDENKLIEIVQKISPDIKKDIMSTYDQLVRKGEIKGEIKGKIEGEIKGEIKGKKEVILNAFENGLAISLISNITKFSEQEVIDVLKEHGKIN
ncbi:MAG: Rpn family recombination-promoting nuclease/putative transposase [Saprospiraceae bacterium]|nr:Rpn family recombination-promoting nuclease/putative transposase [Saprospiraceae bacterium]